MRSDKLFIALMKKNISNGRDIFEAERNLREVLFWGRESAREYISTQPKRYWMFEHIDAVGDIVDKHLIETYEEIYLRGKKGKNGLYTRLTSGEKTVKWLMERWINVFMNFMTNQNYRNYVDVQMINSTLLNESYYEEEIKDDVKKFSKVVILEGLKKVYAEIESFDESESKFDLIDYKKLCSDFGFLYEEIIDENIYIPLLTKVEQATSGNLQLVFCF